MASITGSVRAGMEVARAAAGDLKRVHLELGGKAPVIVFEDSDIASTAETVAMAGYFNAGQDCTAATRVLAASSIHDELVAALAEQAALNKTGAPDDDEVAFGPLNNAKQLDRVRELVGGAPSHSDVVAGGHRVGDRGYFHEATVIAGLRQDDDLIQREIFGPVITVQRFTDEEPPSSGPTASSTVSPPASGRMTMAVRCAWRARWTSAVSGSTRTSHSCRRCHTEGSSIRGTARIFRCTGSRTTRASST